MPSETFNNLSNDKKKLILDAAKKEFSNVSFHEASINHIIKEAGISRGSFYMYFVDKKDLYTTIIEHQAQKHFKFILRILEESEGNLFAAYKIVYERLYQQISQHKKASLEKNIFLNMNFNSENLLIREQVPYQQYKDKFLKMIDTSYWALDTEERLFDIIDMLTLLLVHSLVLSLKKKEQQPMISQKYMRQVDIIEHSVRKGR